MPDYRRAWHPGGTHFFTVNLPQRHDDDRITRRIDMLREIVASVQSRHRFRILVKQGVYPPNWGGENQTALGYDD